MRVLLDMNLSPVWVRFLERAGIAAVHWSTIGTPTAEDGELMAWARLNACVVFTNDLDFSALLALARATGPSVAAAPNAGSHAGRRWGSRRDSSLLAEGAILTVDERGARVRVLPLKTEPA